MCNISVAPMPSMICRPVASNQSWRVAAGSASPAATHLRSGPPSGAAMRPSFAAVAIARYEVGAVKSTVASNSTIPASRSAIAEGVLARLRANAGRVVNISSDAAVEAYPGWGNYGASKAALDHVSAVLSEEEPDLRVYAVDPGDMNTAMHQAAFPGEDISDREDPAAVAATLLPLIDSTLPSGRYCAAELPAAVTS